MRRLLIIVGITAAVLVVLGLIAVGPLLSPTLNEKVTTVLAERFESTADLRDLDVSVFPEPRVWGGGLRLQHRGRTDLPPLIALEQFDARATYWGLLRRPRRLEAIGVRGLRLHIPPKSAGRPIVPAGDEKLPERDAERAGTPVVIGRITSENAVLEIAHKEQGKPPTTFRIARLTLESVALDRPMRFSATLRNPKPPGAIDTHGEFGPWRGDEPATTPVRGEYVFKKADLGVFKGIAGTLGSRGTYAGILERIAVKGETTTPDFTLTSAGHPVSLTTKFDAIVDGTNGNTLLKPVRASFLKTSVVADGGVVRTEDKRGRDIVLDVKIAPARIEDLLQLTVKATRPLMTGPITADAKLRIPAGEEDVVDKLELDGSFHIASATFTDVDVQRSLAKLSQRGRGVHDAEAGESVASDLGGKFRMRKGVITFSSLTFAIPGASVELRGSYALRTEALDFRGRLRLQARLSETQTGFKARLLKIFDPLFKRHGAGAEIPIKISGARNKPKFGLDVGAMLPGN
jgi:AsmA-like C-terminal region